MAKRYLKKRYLLLTVVLLGGSGCGDSPAALAHDEIVALNELADMLSRVVDGESAKYFKDVHLEKTKKHFENLKKRLEDYLKNQGYEEVYRVSKELGQLILGDLKKQNKAFSYSAGREMGDKIVNAWSSQKDDSNRSKIRAAQKALDVMMPFMDPMYHKEIAMANTRKKRELDRINHIQGILAKQSRDAKEMEAFGAIGQVQSIHGLQQPQGGGF